MRRCALLLPLLMQAGCLVTQSQNTPVKPTLRIERTTGREYWLYVPSTHDAKRSWPLVITLHGGGPWDSARKQIREWRSLAEMRGAIVAAPKLRSTSLWNLGREGWMKSLAEDERLVLAIIREVSGTLNVPPRAVLLTGFLDGGHALYFIGLRNPDKLGMVIARDCYTDLEMLEGIELTDAARKLPIVVSNGKDGWWAFPKHGWRAYRFLRENRCFQTWRKESRGGQLRQPGKAYEYWMRYARPNVGALKSPG